MGEADEHDELDSGAGQLEKPATPQRDAAVNHLLDDAEYRDEAADRRDSKAYRRDMEANLRSFVNRSDDSDAFEDRASATQDRKGSKGDRTASKQDRDTLADMLLSGDGEPGQPSLSTEE
jgi:hypothetical protein